MSDIIVVGGGSNSLTAACYLAKAGLSVTVLERNNQAGGGVVSVVTAPGFIGDSHAVGYMTLMGNPVIKYDELQLREKFGLEWLYNKSPFGTLFSDGTGLMSFRDLERTCAEIANFSERDADAYRDFVKEVSIFLPLLMRGFYAPPMPEKGFYGLLRESEEGRKLLRFLNMSALEILNERFEHPVVKMHFGKWCSEMMIGPDVKGAGIAVVLILSMSHEFEMGTVKGGAKNLTNALIACLQSHGGDMLLNKTVRRVIVRSGKCVGVELSDGEELFAKKAVLANIHPWRLGDMVEGVPSNILERARQVKLSEYGALNQQYALTEAPKWKAGEKYSDVTTLEILDNDYDGFLASFNDYRNGKMPLQHLAPLVNTLSNIDPSRAPEGQAAVYLYSFAPFEIEGGWENKKTETADAIFDWFAGFTENLDRSKIIARHVDSPADHARHSMNRMKGDIMGCAMGFGQILGGRPIPELADYTVPAVENLYLVGPTQHPGGTVTLGGRATAMKMLDDFEVDLKSAFSVY